MLTDTILQRYFHILWVYFLLTDVTIKGTFRLYVYLIQAIDLIDELLTFLTSDTFA